MSTKRRNTNRTTDYMSAKIFGKERISKVERYCEFMDMSTKDFIQKAIDSFFQNEKQWLESMTREQLINYILSK